MKNKKTQFILLLIAILLIGGAFIFNQKRGLTQSKNKAIQASINPIQAVYHALPEKAKSFYYQQSEGLTKPVPERLVELDQLTIGCFGPNAVTEMSSTDTNLGGQCCGVLKDIEAYKEQLTALSRFIKNNREIEFIPKDPYDIPIAQAQALITLDKDIILTSKQQNTYDEAVRLSHHGGPCCCRCWKWYMMSGLGKKLIVDHGFEAKKLAELWDLASSCGHDKDVKMHEHYKLE